MNVYIMVLGRHVLNCSFFKFLVWLNSTLVFFGPNLQTIIDTNLCYIPCIPRKFA